MAAKEFRNDPRRNNFNNLMKKAELYIVETTKKPEFVKPEPTSAGEKTKAVSKPTGISKIAPTRIV